MTKQEFLRTLRGKITGAMDQSEVESQISYYSEYIDGLIASGKTEEEAVEELGDPLLIAKTLGNAVEGGYIDSDYQGGSHAGGSGGSSYTYNDATGSSGGYSDQSQFGNGYSGHGNRDQSGNGYGSYGNQSQSGNGYGSYGNQSQSGNGYGSYGYGSYGQSGRNQYNNAYEGDDIKSKAGRTWQRIKPVVILIAGIVVILFCIFLFFRACFAVGGCLFSSFWPIIIIALVVGLLTTFFRRR